MRRTASFALFALLVAATPAQPAAAAEPEPSDPPRRAEPPVALALVSGIATALIPIVLGGIHTAAAPVGDDPARNVGYAVAGVGPALAPIVAHAVLGEWKRALAFGAAPVAAEIGVCAFLAAKPDAAFHGDKGSRTLFGLLYTLDVFGAAVGLVDVMMAHERARPDDRRRTAAPFHGVTLAPSVGHGRAGVVLGGTL